MEKFCDCSKEGQNVVLLKDGEFIWAVNHKVFKLIPILFSLRDLR